jgi:hypothetical protein
VVTAMWVVAYALWAAAIIAWLALIIGDIRHWYINRTEHN